MKFFGKILRRFVLAVLILGVLLAFFVAEENWRGHRALVAYQKKLEAEGFRFGPEVLRGPAIPDPENFAATPLLQPLFQASINPQTGYSKLNDEAAPEKIAPTSELLLPLTKSAQGGSWQKGEAVKLDLEAIRTAMAALEKYEPQMKEIQTAARRPSSVYPLRYEAGFSLGLHYLLPLMNFTRAFSGRASAKLQLQDPSGALQDATTSLQLDSHLESPALLIGSLVYSAELFMAMRPVWDGLRLHAWDSQQLDLLEMALAAIHPLDQYASAVRGEMALLPLNFDLWRKLPLTSRNESNAIHEVTFQEKLLNTTALPGWSDCNELLLLQWHRQSLNEIDAASRRFFPERWKNDMQMANAVPWRPWTYRAKISLGIVPSVAKKAAIATQQIDFAHAGFALERYWLVHRAYPSTLNMLVPTFIAQLPHDVCNGEPLHYRQEGEGYRIWSVGYDLKDENGTIAFNYRGGPIDYDKGDWVWLIPGSADFTAAPAQ